MVSGVDLMFIKKFEGFSNVVYQDSAGLPTIGYGHLIRQEERARWAPGITEEEADLLLKVDADRAARAIARLIHVPLSQGQFTALLSFTFNLGSGALQRSTLRAKVNRSEHGEVPAELMRWVWAGGRRSRGLERRRAAEAALYRG